MTELPPLPPTHLAVFITDPESGGPVQQLPIYAEVAVPRVPPERPMDDFLWAPVRDALNDVDSSSASPDVLETMAKALGQALDDLSLEALRNDHALAHNFATAVFERVLVLAGVSHISQIPKSKRLPFLLDAVRDVAQRFGLPLYEDKHIAEPIWAEPVGVLATDHVGYASFDLTRLRSETRRMLADAIAARRQDLNAVLRLTIWVYLYNNPKRVDVLNQARFTADAVVARLTAVRTTLPANLRNMGLRALQNPGLTDWRLSPASFAATPKTLVGADGCEELQPASLALQQFVLRQVVRLKDPPPAFGLPAAGDYRAAYIDEYKVSWYSLGHSLGEILYSLPLAPGETVKLAVVDWSWDSLTKRDETTQLTEDLLHRTHRDRTITETTRAGVNEMQTGSSFMAGGAHSGGGSAGANLGVVGIGAAVGDAFALGGSTATSEGSRHLAAENVQRLSDSFSQASSIQREINSTVVIQARQEETESIQTRTFSNYNHSHTLTILYYEVLRHFRVTVEWVRRRPAVLAKHPKRIADFTDSDLLKYRFLLEPALLEPTLKDGFAALERREEIAHFQQLHGINPATPQPAPWWEGDVELELFEIGIWTDDDTINNITVYIVTAAEHALSKKYELHYVYKGSGDGNYLPHNLNSGERMETTKPQFTFVKIGGQPVDGDSIRIKWKDIIGFQFEKWGNTEWRITGLSIRGWDKFGFVVDFTPPLEPVDLFILGKQPGSQTFSKIKRPSPPPAQPAPILTPDKSLSSAETYKLKQLREHVSTHIDHYASLVQLNTDTAAIARLFETVPWPPGTMDDNVEPIPLGVFGSYVAYPLLAKEPKVDDALVVDIAVALNGADPAAKQKALDDLAAMTEADRASVLERLPLASAKSERLITLPTRGVFAEGKLGHCSISEEIDETRFWKWEQHPIPVQAPEIGTVTPIQPAPQQVSASPTPFPSSVLNIVNPSAAPDPGGLTAALGLLGSPNIFRDMSGRQEVAALLKQLSDNTIGIAEAATKAREIQAKYGADLDKSQKNYDLGVEKVHAESVASHAAVASHHADALAAKAQADAARAEADAKKAEIEAGVQQAESAKFVPKPMREPVQQAAANALAGNPTKSKAIIFRAIGFDGQSMVGPFAVEVRDATTGSFVVQTQKSGPYGEWLIAFKSSEPIITAFVGRKAGIVVEPTPEGPILTTQISTTSESSSIAKNHRVIDLLLTQGSRDVQFKATSTANAVNELVSKVGAELGIDKVIAGKLIAAYEKKNAITHGASEEKSYTVNVPTQNYTLKVTSKR